MNRAELERLDREALVQRAQAAGVRRARLLTRPELVDELLRLDPSVDPAQLKKTRGFFGRARDLLTRVVERGLHLPDAADRLRAALSNASAPPPDVPRPEAQAVPTVTLAEIYAAQGHKQRAIDTLRRVLKAEPDHGAARALLERLEAADYVPPDPPLPPEREPEPEPETEDPSTRFPGQAWLDEPVTLKRNRPDLAPRDECVAIPVGADSTYVWWRLSEASWRRLAEDAVFFVRVIVLRPTWDGPEEQIRDAACDASAGEFLFHLAPLPLGAVVRVAIGTTDARARAGSGSFVPLAHSPALERLETRDENGLVEWTLDGFTPISERASESDPRWSSIAIASERAARI